MDDNDTKSLDTLKHSDWNPRRIDKHDFDALVNSMREFGDLSGIVKNITTGTLVGGNQRLEALKKMKNPRIKILKRFDAADEKGTMAVGFIETDEGSQFAYREVMWNLEREKSANIAANRIQGEFDLDLLAKINYELSQLPDGDQLLKLTGQTEDEIFRLLKSVGVGGDDGTGDELDKRNVIEIHCDNDEQVQAVYEEMAGRGFKCRILSL